MFASLIKTKVMEKEQLAAGNALASQIQHLENQIKAIERTRQQQNPPFTENPAVLNFAILIGGVSLVPTPDDYLGAEDLEEIAEAAYDMWLKKLRKKLKEMEKEFRFL